MRAALLRHPDVLEVTLVGSRAGREATPLSDWDFLVRVGDVEAVRRGLPSLVAPLRPLAEQWDRLGPRSYSCYMLMLSGPRKVDLIFEVPHVHEPPWVLTRETLEAIDRHAWDWLLWLASKSLRGDHGLVREQLAEMSVHLLRPLGVERVPATIDEAVEAYRGARDRSEVELGVRVPRRLEREVLPVLAEPS